MEQVILEKDDLSLTAEKYFGDFSQILSQTLKDSQTQRQLLQAVKLLKSIKNTKQKVILVGNGGSAAIAEHMAIDFAKNAGVRAVAISGTPQLTTFANDYGYEFIYSKALELQANQNDILMAISSGGESVNILNAVKTAKQLGCFVITFSAFKENNSLRQLGDINIYVPSSAYGYVEIIHNLLIHYINDAVIGRAVYKF